MMQQNTTNDAFSHAFQHIQIYQLSPACTLIVESKSAGTISQSHKHQYHRLNRDSGYTHDK